ncbi:MAG: peptidylprolyl isomerase [Bacteroidales bacterium]
MMVRKLKIVELVALLLIAQHTLSQPLSQKVLLTVADTPVTVDEFKSIYLKNSSSGTSIDSVALDDYLKLFINFKLKVQEARSLKIDTLPAFMAEYQGYIRQLAQPYLTDTSSDEQLINEAYDRMQYDISASHILISVPESATPADTLKLYKKAMAARSRLLKGESFGAVATVTSNDPSVTHNSGYLGYFTVFQMVYPFETAAYNTPVDSISMPVRTRFGYHIIKVHDRRPAQGQVKIAHIFVRVQSNGNPEDVENARGKIVEIYEKIKGGEDFATLARDESQDPASAKNGGELPWIRSGQVIPELERVAFGLTVNGQVSEPFQSSVGWHIVKRIARKMVGTKEEMLPEIKASIARDARNVKSRDIFIDKLKHGYSFKDDTTKLGLLRSKLDSGLYQGTWKAPVLGSNPALFSYTGGTYKLSDFASFVELNQRYIGKNSTSNFLKVAYNEWVNRLLLDYEESKLPEKYPEFKSTAREYLEGMLLFEITNRTIWLQSSDSVGIENFYEAHKNRYTWENRVHYAVYSAANVRVKDQLVKNLPRRTRKNLSPENFALKFNKNKALAVTVEEKAANPDAADVMGYSIWKNGYNVTAGNDGKFTVVEIVTVTNGDIKSLNDCRGQVIVDYQENLESAWLETLRVKYPVKVDAAVFSELLQSIRETNY